MWGEIFNVNIHIILNADGFTFSFSETLIFTIIR